MSVDARIELDAGERLREVLGQVREDQRAGVELQREGHVVVPLYLPWGTFQRAARQDGTLERCPTAGRHRPADGNAPLGTLETCPTAGRHASTDGTAPSPPAPLPQGERGEIQ